MLVQRLKHPCTLIKKEQALRICIYEHDVLRVRLFQPRHQLTHFHCCPQFLSGPTQASALTSTQGRLAALILWATMGLTLTARTRVPSALTDTRANLRPKVPECPRRRESFRQSRAHNRVRRECVHILGYSSIRSPSGACFPSPSLQCIYLSSRPSPLRL